MCGVNQAGNAQTSGPQPYSSAETIDGIQIVRGVSGQLTLDSDARFTASRGRCPARSGRARPPTGAPPRGRSRRPAPRLGRTGTRVPSSAMYTQVLCGDAAKHRDRSRQRRRAPRLQILPHRPRRPLDPGVACDAPSLRSSPPPTPPAAGPPPRSSTTTPPDLPAGAPSVSSTPRCPAPSAAAARSFRRHRTRSGPASSQTNINSGRDCLAVNCESNRLCVDEAHRDSSCDVGNLEDATSLGPPRSGAHVSSFGAGRPYRSGD